MGCFVSYAHDPDGIRRATALVEVLRAKGIDVRWDRDLWSLAPLSLQSWIEREFRTRTVLVVLSDAFLEAFTSDDYVLRKGVRYEARLIRQKIYHHDGAEGCAVVPIAPLEFDANLVPAALQALMLQRFDPGSEAGTAELVQCVGALEAAEGGATMSVDDPASRRTLREVRCELENVPPGEERGWELVQECLRIEDGDLEFARAFPLAVEVAQAHGDVPLVRLLTERCLAILRAMDHRPREDQLLEARALISGRAWRLQREHRLVEALAAAERGTRLAEKYGDRRVAALGVRCSSRIHLRQAQDVPAQESAHYLSLSAADLERATTLFRAVAGPRTHEVGECALLSAKIQLARYTLLGDRAALDTATERASVAEELLEPGTGSYARLTLLRARICLANRRCTEGRTLATSVIEALKSLYPEILGRAYETRAELLLARGSKPEAIADFERAAEIFHKIGYEYAAAACWWAVVRVAPAKVAQFRLSHADVERLEELAVDPRIRQGAVREHEKQTAKRLIPSAGRRPVDWARLVDRVQHEGDWFTA